MARTQPAVVTRSVRANPVRGAGPKPKDCAERHKRTGQESGYSRMVSGRARTSDTIRARSRPESGWVTLGVLGVYAAGGGGPLVPAGPGLGDGPAGALLDVVAGPASGSGIARTRLAALVVGRGVLKIGLASGAVAGRERAGAVADLDEVAELVGRLVGAGLVAVVAVVYGDRVEAHGEQAAARDGERPGGLVIEPG